MSSSKAFPDFDNLYSIGDPHVGSPYRGRMAVEDDFGITRAVWVPEKAVEVTHAMGGEPQDVIWTTNAIPMLVHQRVVGMCEASRFTGWETYPVAVKSKHGDRIPDYQGFAVHGRCGPLDDERSERRMKQFPALKRMILVGRYFEEESWDGSDFFMPADGTGFIFVTARVKEAFEKEKITNVAFLRITEIEHRPRK